jgi:eukaryotic-like serine/threonine-protein kinase
MAADRKRFRVLGEVARKIADGSSVDWDELSESHADLRKSFERLRVVEAVAAVHRSPLPEERLLDRTGPPAETPARPGPQDDAPPIRSWGRLQVGPLLGRGSSGEVYRAHDSILKKDVALKLVRPSRRGNGTDRFLQEARRLASVRHENVLVVHGADEHDGRLGLWTDHIDGWTLEQQLQSQGNLNASEAALVGRQVCRALAAVHGAGLVHRDVKTHNLMRRRTDGQIVLMDFSAAARRPPTSDALATDPVAGTPLFLAPEVLRGEEALIAADIYALGVVLYRLVTGRFPVEARSFRELCEKHRKGGSVPLMDRRPDLPDGFIRVVDKALDPDPARRYASMAEMERDLERVLYIPRPDPPKPWPWWKRVAAAASVAGVGILAWLIVRPPPGPLRMTVDLVRLSHPGAEKLPAGATVYPTDYLSLEIQGSRPMHVYAFNINPFGELIVLFPDRGLALRNPLDPGMVHRLPGVVGGNPNYWRAGRQSGPESFYVFASREPLAEAVRLIERAEGSIGQPAGRGEIQRGRPRGLDQVFPGSLPLLPKDKESEGLMRVLLDKSDTDPMVRAWKIRVENNGG